MDYLPYSWALSPIVELVFSLMLFSCSVMSNSLWPHELQHTRLPCPSPSPRVCSNSCPLSQCPSIHLLLYHPLLPLVFPSIGFFSSESHLWARWPKCWSFSLNISPSSEYSGLISFRIDWFNSLQSKEFSRVFYNTTVQKHQFFGTQPFLLLSSQIHT